MSKEVKIETHILEISSRNEMLHNSNSFNNWNDAEFYLRDRIKLKKERQIFKVKIGDKYFGEFNGKTFRTLNVIEKEFTNKLNNIIEDIEEKEDEINFEKRSRIEIRIAEKEKENVLKKCKKLGLNISEYTRQLYEYGEVIVVSDQTKRDVRGMAVNLNQIAKRMNSGVISPNTVIENLQRLLEELNKTYNR